MTRFLSHLIGRSDLFTSLLVIPKPSNLLCQKKKLAFKFMVGAVVEINYNNTTIFIGMAIQF